MKDLRIVFMGTPEFATETLRSLLDNGYDIAGVVTTPDRPSGRGRKINKPAVKEFAESRSLPVMQPDNLKDPGFTEMLKKLNADIFIVVAFRMLPEVVWRIPTIRTFNLHASLLPHYRGAAPIHHAIINGEKVTGVTTFLIDDKIDTGNILLREEAEILPCENAGDIHDKLMKLGAGVVIRTLKGLSEGSIKPEPQSQFIKPGELLKLAPKIFPPDCIVNWNNIPVKINDLIRGLAPYPCARSFLTNNKSTISFKIFESKPENAEHRLRPGEIISDGREYIKVACKDGFINIVSLQLEGKKRMNASELLRGFRISGHTIPVSWQA